MPLGRAVVDALVRAPLVPDRMQRIAKPEVTRENSTGLGQEGAPHALPSSPVRALAAAARPVNQTAPNRPRPVDELGGQHAAAAWFQVMGSPSAVSVS